MTNDLKPDELAMEIQEFMGRKFTHPAHIVFLLELSNKSELREKFSELMFTAKYVTGLKKIVSSGSYTEDKYLEKIFKEFNVNVQKMINILDEYLEDSSNSTGREMKNDYLKLDHESLAKSLELAEDLSLCKEYFNRKSGNSENK